VETWRCDKALKAVVGGPFRKRPHLAFEIEIERQIMCPYIDTYTTAPTRLGVYTQGRDGCIDRSFTTR